MNQNELQSFLSRLNQPMSRRGALTGLAGVALAPSVLQGSTGSGPGRGHRLGDTSNTGIIRWQQRAINPILNVQSATHFNGVAYAVLNNDDGAASFYCLPPFADYQQIGHTDRTYVNDLVKMPAIGSIVMLTSAGTVDGFGPSLNPWSINLGNNADSNLVVVNGNTIVVLTEDRCLSAFTLDGNGGSSPAWKTNQLPINAWNAVYVQAVSDNSFLLLQPDVTGNGHAQAYYVNTTDLIVPPFEAEFATGPFIVAAPYFYCLADDGNYWSITQNSINNDPNFKPWARQNIVPDSNTVGNPILYNGSIYLPSSDDSQVHSIDVNTGLQGTSIPAPSAFGRNMVIENGAVFYALPGGAVYGIDFTSTPPKQVTYTFPSGQGGSGLTSAVFMCGVENGMAVVIDNQGMMNGLDLASELRQYSCDSVLIAEDYVAGNSGAQPANPAYRTTLQLLDQNGNPRANTGVRVEATDTVTITSGGVSTSLANAGDSMWLTTDPGGNLDFVCAAVDVQSPALHIWAAFMNQNESIVIYPDHQAITKLAGQQASDYQGALGFDGTPVLTDGVSGDDVSQAVKNTLGTFNLPVSNPYAAFAKTASNMVYQSVKGATARAVTPGAPTTFTFNIPGDSNSAALNANPTASLFKAFDDFKNEVAKGGKKLAKFIVTVADTISHEIHSIEGDIYRFTITCLEDAITALTGLFKTVFKDIMKAVEFLSALFDWAAIKLNHQAIIDRVTQTRAKLRNYLTADSDALKTRIHTMLTGWIGPNHGDTARSSVDAANGQYGSTSVQSAQSGGSDPKQVFGSGGHAQTKSFHSKIKDNSKSASSPIIPTTLPLTPQVLFSQIQDLIENLIPNAISDIKPDLLAAWNDFVTGFKEIFTDPMGFVTSEFSALLNLLKALVGLVLEAADLVLQLLITLLADLVDTIFSLLTGEFNIPILSDLFKLIFGRNLSLLDLAAWAIAVPVTIAQKAMSLSSVKSVGNAAQDFFASVSLFTGCLIDGLNDATNGDPASPLNWIDLGVGVLTAGLQFPADADFSNDAQIVYYAMGWVPLILCGANAINATILNVLPRTEAQQGLVDGFNIWAYDGASACGLLMSAFTVIASKLGNPAFEAVNFKVNLTANLALMTKFLDFSGRPVTVLSDMVCPTAAMFIGLLSSV